MLPVLMLVHPEVMQPLPPELHVQLLKSQELLEQ